MVAAFDPVVRAIADMPQIRVSNDPYEAAEGADAVVLVTDWPELRTLNLTELRSRMRGAVFVDGRNVIDPHEAARAGLVYEGVGRGAVGERRRSATRSLGPAGNGAGRSASADVNLTAPVPLGA